MSLRRDRAVLDPCPWRIPSEKQSPELKAALAEECGPSGAAATQRHEDSIDGLYLPSLARLDLRPDEALLGDLPLPDPISTHSHHHC